MPGPHFISKLPDVHLEITQGQARVKLRPVNIPVFLIGRASDCDLVLGDEQFPDVHMYIFVTSTSVTLRCLGDGPEVTVDGRPVTTLPLRSGDRIRTGPYEFSVHIDYRRIDDRPDIRPFPAGDDREDAVDTAHAESVVRQLLHDVRHQVLPSYETAVRQRYEPVLPRRSA